MLAAKQENVMDGKPTNPLVDLISQDLSNRRAWADRDEKILKKRMGERAAKRNKPYPGAPNFVVPIIDDTTREKTDQEVTMLANAKRMAHIVALSSQIPAEQRTKAEMGFDTYLRFVIQATTKIDEALDCKNARGFAVLKVIRSELPRWGTMPDFEVRDIRNCIVPTTCKNIQNSPRVTDVYFYDKDEFERIFKKRALAYKDVVKRVVAEGVTEESKKGSDEQDTLEVTENLIGIVTTGKANAGVTVFEVYCWADEWIAGQDRTKRVKKGDKCRVTFAKKLPDELIEVEPWREADEFVKLGDQEVLAELMAAAQENRPAETVRQEAGKPRPWPHIQCRYENRSSYFYDSRGVGQICMDEQLAATAMQNGKMVMIDYYQLPLFRGPGTRGSTNITHEPGSVLPEGMEAVQMPSVPAQFDFDIESHKRNAARRAGALGQYEFSGDFSTRKRVQKTATEVQQESARGTLVSSASVDRFNNPWSELFMQLWEDLKRLQIALPLITAQMTFDGTVDLSVYDWPVMIVPASSAKTLDPDAQFQRNVSAWQFAAGALAPMGVTLDAQAAAEDCLSNWDPFLASRWIVPPGQQGPQGQQPVYATLATLQQQMAAVIEAVKAIGKSHLEAGPQ